MKKRLVVGLSGASGIPIAVEILRQLKNIPDIETHLVYTKGAELTAGLETELTLSDIRELADVVFNQTLPFHLRIRL